MYTTSDFKKGLKIIYKDKPCEILDFNRFKMGRCGSLVRTKLKILSSEQIINIVFKSGEKFDAPNFIEKTVQYIYTYNNYYYFIDLIENVEFFVSNEKIGNLSNYLTEGLIIKVIVYNSEILDIILPNTIVLEVLESDSVKKGNTISNLTKYVKLSTNYICLVPSFIEIGDKITISTITGEYVDRFGKKK